MTSHSNRRLKDIFNIKTTQGRLSLILLTIGVVLILGLFTYSSVEVSMLPQFCSLCHEMKPEVVTWQASVHSDYACTECHTDQSFSSVISTKGAIFSQYLQHFEGTYAIPIELQKDISNKTCLKCHSLQREVSPPDGLVFPHQSHVDKGFKCIQCHNNVAHGGIQERGFTINTDYNKWTKGMGKAYMKENFTVLDMQSCIDCHTDKGKSTTCTTCHSGSINLPQTHLNASWKNGQHGLEALKNVDQCDKCHSYADSYLVKPGPNKAAQYARNNEFCSTCHLKKPPSHTADWRQIHRKQASVNEPGCLACHDENRPGTTENAVTTTYCVKCHANANQHGNVVNNHPPFSLVGKTLDASCLKCHPAIICNKCHYVKEGESVKK